LEKREVIRIKVMIQIRNKRKEKRIKKGKERILIPLLNHNYQKVQENQIRKIKIKKKMENVAELNRLNGSLQSNKLNQLMRLKLSNFKELMSQNLLTSWKMKRTILMMQRESLGRQETLTEIGRINN
jgi:hypothetical protein